MNNIDDLKRRAGITESRKKINENLLMFLSTIFNMYVKELEQNGHDSAVDKLRAKGLDDKIIGRMVDLYSEVQSKQQLEMVPRQF